MIDTVNTYDGNVSSYTLTEVMANCNRYRYICEPGHNNDAFNGMEDPYSTNFDDWYQWPNPPYVKKCIAIGIGNDASAVWGLFNEADYVRRYVTDGNPSYSDLTMTAYATTAPVSFGNTGTGDGNFTNPCDISLRQTDNRIYVVDQPGDELRIQAFSNSTGNFLGTSDAIDIPDAVSVYRMDHNDCDGLIYVLLSNNTIRVFRDMM